MRKSAKYIFGAAAVLLLIVAGTILPGELAAGRDRMILGQVYSEPLDTAELSDYINVSMVDKVSLLEQAAGATLVRLNTGAVYDQDTVRAQFMGELGKLHALRFYPLEAERGVSAFRSAVALYIQNDAPAINMIVWEIHMRADSLSGVFYMDDQTGRILSFTFSGNGFGEQIYDESMVKEWAAYLGVGARNIKAGGQAEARQTREALYHFELFSGSRAVNGQISSSVQAGAGTQNRWSVSYVS